MVANPRNCEMIILGHDGKGRLQLDGRCDLELREKRVHGKTTIHENEHDGNYTQEQKVTESNRFVKEGPAHEMEMTNDGMLEVHGYKFYKRLRIVPERHMRTRAIRLSYDG
jgi:hypothetical protein